MKMSADRHGIVMIVDDTPANLAFLSDALDSAGYEVLVALSGLTALRQLELVRPDVILLDAVMPGLSGFETCQRLKAQPETRAIPVIFMTALSTTEAVVRGFGEGAVDYVTKPVREEEVIARINAHIVRSRNLRRATSAVEALPRPSLTVDGSGNVTWLSERARALLPGPDWRLPPEVIRWLTRCRETDEETGRSLAFTHNGEDFRITYCDRVDPDESLLLLEGTGAAAEERLAVAFRLTPREADVLRWVMAGKTNRDIGTILATSPRTVTKHLEHVFTKLGVETRTAAAARALAVLGSQQQ